MTFWAGALSILVGTLMLFEVGDPEQIGRIATIMTALTGGYDASPVQLITVGFGLIGLRRAVKS